MMELVVLMWLFGWQGVKIQLLTNLWVPYVRSDLHPVNSDASFTIWYSINMHTFDYCWWCMSSLTHLCHIKLAIASLRAHIIIIHCYFYTLVNSTISRSKRVVSESSHQVWYMHINSTSSTLHLTNYAHCALHLTNAALTVPYT